MRDKPSTRARERSYVALRRLMYLLWLLEISQNYYEGDDETKQIDFLGWKQWANTYTPSNKRGGVGNFK